MRIEVILSKLRYVAEKMDYERRTKCCDVDYINMIGVDTVSSDHEE